MGAVKKSINVFFLTVFIMLIIAIVFGSAGLLPERFFSELSIVVLFPYFVVQSLILSG